MMVFWSNSTRILSNGIVECPLPLPCIQASESCTLYGAGALAECGPMWPHWLNWTSAGFKWLNIFIRCIYSSFSKYCQWLAEKVLLLFKLAGHICFFNMIFYIFPLTVWKVSLLDISNIFNEIMLFCFRSLPCVCGRFKSRNNNRRYQVSICSFW